MLGGHYFFDHKHVILKSWTSKMDFEKEDIKTFPI